MARRPCGVSNSRNSNADLNVNLNEFFSWLCVGAYNYYNSNGNLKIPESFINATRNIVQIESPDPNIVLLKRCD